MKPGTKLDALVVEKIFDGNVAAIDVQTGEKVRLDMPLPYSTSISAAWEVVEKLAAHVRIQFGVNTRAHVYFVTREQGSGNAEAQTVPHAICLAALKAVGAL